MSGEEFAGQVRTPDEQPQSVVYRFAGLRMVVVGDAVLDLWMYGATNRLSREAPVPVVEVGNVDLAPGAAANCAANAAALGADVQYVGLVGDDWAGEALGSILAGRGVRTDGLVVHRGGTTLTKRRIMCGEHMIARFDSTPCRWPEPSLAALRDAFGRAVRDADVVVVADYGGGALADPFPQLLRRLRDSIRGPVVVDGHEFARWRVCRPTAITPSLGEAAALADLPAETDRAVVALQQCADELTTRAGSEMVVTTLDAAGTMLVRPGRAPHRTRPAEVAAPHPCGAGDTYTTVFALSLAAGADATVAADVAQCAADVVVRQPGTGCCTPAALSARLATCTGVVRDHDALARLVAEQHAAGRRIVFTNGCFDVLHLGHVEYLREARRLGDMVVVGVNSDDSVTRLKGPGRPVVGEWERASLLAALEMVDLVTIFDAPTAGELIERLRPDVYVKGGDYTPEMLAEAELMDRIGGEVVTVGYLPNHSTTELVGRIQAGLPR